MSTDRRQTIRRMQDLQADYCYDLASARFLDGEAKEQRLARADRRRSELTALGQDNPEITLADLA